ncbi:MAG: DUF2721 domain-containing protein [Candidatus Eremiobacteraeota bacterium]|nr:DUF2721 domain-containing protein [Candidatus Eremiobacteraeota bacterium]
MNGLTQNAGLAIVSAMIAPAILILAAGSLVSSTLVRLGRIVDQTRALLSSGEHHRGSGDQRGLALIESRIDLQLRRAELARRALLGYYLSIFIFLLSSLLIALFEAVHLSKLFWIGPAFVILGGGVLLFATASLVVEVNISAGTLHEEVRVYRQG